MKFYGDPEKLADYVVVKVLEETRPEVGKAEEDALNLLEQAYQSILEEARGKLHSEYARAADEIRSVEASLEKDIKLEASKKRSQAVERVLEEVLSRLSELPVGDKQAIYQRLVRDFVEKAQGGEEYTVKVREGEASLIKKVFNSKEVSSLLKEKSIKISIKEGLESKLGGFRAESGDGRIVFDYTLELVFESLRPMLSGVASRTLFGE